jgi:regulator of sigma E protease
MVIISAGVVMNVILAFALYVGLFMHGFNAPPSVVGQVLPGSPADIAGLKPGDKILAINGKPQQDYQKLRMNIALLRTDEAAQVDVERANGTKETIPLTPAINTFEYNMPAIGVMQAATLDGPKESAIDEENMLSPDIAAMPAGSRVVRVGDLDVSGDKNAYRLFTAINQANGRPVPVTIRYADGSEHPYSVRATLMRRFGDTPDATKDARSIGGLLPRVRMIGVQKDKPADKAGLKPGDVIEQMMIVGSNEARRPPTYAQFMEWVDQAGQAGKKIRLTVLRDGKSQDPIEIDPTLQLGKRRGIGAWPDLDLGAPVVAGVLPGTAAANAGIKTGDTVVSVNGKPATTWADVLTELQAAKGDAEVALTSEDGGTPRTVKLALGESDKTLLTQVAFMPLLGLEQQLLEPRKTSNPLTAAVWGYEETKEQIFNVYVTLRRLFEGRVPLSNLSGPVGIFTAGTAVASRGLDWLVWFAALISANLAVVNFLPIPIVDGGLFTFLIVEKIQGRPLSMKTQQIAQFVGLAIILSVFLLVTYQDIARIAL